ncbi:MAG TPA: spore coat protein U domain-containing protein [Steroidobacteraceae bacterium]|nr:spore coat protein U domain-containing protein [Steroidobacteraceae bacterium]
MRKLLKVALAAGALSAGAAHAGATSTTFPVTATVQATCSATASPLGFGTYTPGVGPLTANTPISVQCTQGTAFTVALNRGSTTGGTIGQRLMANGTNTLQYNLYTVAGLTTVFGDGTTGSTVGGTGAGVGVANAQTVTVYGQLPDNAVNQAAVPSATPYSDLITVSITY